MLNPDLETLWSDFTRSLARKGRSPATVEVYRKSYESFWNFTKGSGTAPNPAAVTFRDINAWTDHLLEQPATRGGRIQYDTDPTTGKQIPRPTSRNTVRIRWQNLRPFFSWWSRELDERNPFDKADTPSIDEQPTAVVSLNDVRALLAAADGKGFEERRDTALIRLMFDTGARNGEVMSMTVESWDRRSDLVTLTGKTGTRLVPISASTGEAFARYLRVRAQHRRADLEVLWLGTRGALGASGLAQMLYRRADEAGVPRMHPHQLRHTWAHLLKQEDVTEGDLMQLGGWSSPAMVHRYGKSAAVARAQQTARRVSIGDQL